MKYTICYATDAICWTQAPEKLSDLKKQRKRWHLGLFQSMIKHRKMLFNPKFGAVGYISYLYFLIYELLSPFIEIFGVLTMLLAFAMDLINIPFMVLFFLIYAVFGSVLSLTAFFSRPITLCTPLRECWNIPAVWKPFPLKRMSRSLPEWMRTAKRRCWSAHTGVPQKRSGSK